ncbi:hypothetical protein OPT61_g1589 [Boeremia exigua]|uniref:Uncharacterized protein n=1 Tax=Boeremia exigua TaxID=749465 RepID=A0ACC2IPQ0_9PLEO|nr:hypothetical protein OPT61_g1589 [Boeremia exigua]
MVPIDFQKKSPVALTACVDLYEAPEQCNPHPSSNSSNLEASDKIPEDLQVQNAPERWECLTRSSRWATCSSKAESSKLALDAVTCGSNPGPFRPSPAILPRPLNPSRITKPAQTPTSPKPQT